MKKLIVFMLAAVMMLSLCTAPAGASVPEARENVFDLVIGASEGGNDEFTVTVTVENITTALHIVEYVVTYDSEKLELINSVDEDGVLDCIPRLPKNWENFVGVQKVGEINAIALTVDMAGLESGALTFEFKFRVKQGAVGETKIDIADESVQGAYVGEQDVDEYVGTGGSVSFVINESGSIGDVSTDTETVIDGGDDPQDEEDGMLTTILVITGIAAAVIAVVIAVIVILKKKK